MNNKQKGKEKIGDEVVMKKFTFKQQILYGIVLVIVGNSIAFVSHNGIFANITWIIYGFTLLINPVYPERASWTLGDKKARTVIRLCGVICILLGILIRV